MASVRRETPVSTVNAFFPTELVPLLFLTTALVRAITIRALRTSASTEPARIFSGRMNASSLWLKGFPADPANFAILTERRVSVQISLPAAATAWWAPGNSATTGIKLVETDAARSVNRSDAETAWSKRVSASSVTTEISTEATAAAPLAAGNSAATGFCNRSPASSVTTETIVTATVVRPIVLSCLSIVARKEPSACRIVHNVRPELL